MKFSMRGSAMWELTFVGLLLFTAAGVSKAARALQYWDDAAPLAVIAAATLIFSITHRVRISRPLAFLLLGFLAYYLLLTFKYQQIHPKFLVIYPFNFLLTFVCLRGMGLRYFRRLEQLITFFSFVALLFWLLHILAPGELVDLGKRFTILEPYDSIVIAHPLLYTVVNEDVHSAVVRNAGFAWEPGAFGVLVGLGIFLNQIRTRFRIRRNWGLFVLSIAALSTQSTTAYSILLLLLVFHVLNMRTSVIRVMSIPVLIVAVVYASTLPFMAEKLSGLLSEQVEELVDSSQQEWNKDTQLNAQRFASFQIDLKDYLENPILGYGGHVEDMWTRRENINVVSISGIGKVMARFGTVGLTFFLWWTAKSSRQFARIFAYKGSWILLLLILQVSVSYSLIEHPIFMTFWMFALLGGRRHNRAGTVPASPYSLSKDYASNAYQ